LSLTRKNLSVPCHSQLVGKHLQHALAESGVLGGVILARTKTFTGVLPGHFCRSMPKIARKDRARNRFFAARRMSDGNHHRLGWLGLRFPGKQSGRQHAGAIAPCTSKSRI
jgi:hypothetical protein